MKKSLFLVFIVLCLVSCSSAEPNKIVTLPPGSYAIGTDLPAGLWTIMPEEEGNRVTVTWKQGEEVCSKIVIGFGQKDKGSDIVPALDVDLTEGSYLAIKGGSVQLEPNSGDMVWVSRSGKKYHKIADCCAMKNPFHMTEDDAIAKKKTPCSNCCQ